KTIGCFRREHSQSCKGTPRPHNSSSAVRLSCLIDPDSGSVSLSVPPASMRRRKKLRQNKEMHFDSCARYTYFVSDVSILTVLPGGDNAAERRRGTPE